MKKYTLVLFVMVFSLGLFGYNAVSVHADDSGCFSGDRFSRTTGAPCSTTPSTSADRATSSVQLPENAVRTTLLHPTVS